ncbi:MAG: CRTAC1 family protein, partial [bacterium]
FEKVSFIDGRFSDENGAPVPALKDWGLMARFQDIDADGDPDIYVCNDFESPDRIWINDGTGHFKAIDKLALRHTSNSSMAIDFSDIDRDGDLDFLVMDMLSLRHQRRMTQKSTSVPLPHPVGVIENRPQYMRNTLFLNRGDRTYAEIAQYSGIEASEWSWSNLFLDVDLDGYEDVLVATGHYYDAQNLDAMQEADSRIKFSAMAIKLSSQSPAKKDRLNTLFLYPKLDLPERAFRNRGDLTFEEVGSKWGFTTADISHGMALGDLDNDGDPDVIMNRLNEPAAIYRNQSPAPRIAVRLRGQAPNTQGIGAKIRVLGGPAPQSKEAISGGAYLSSSDYLYVFAAGKANDLTIEVQWRDGKISTVSGVKPNRIYEIDEASAQPAESNKTVDDASRPVFEDASHLLSHQHHEDAFDDFKKQPLLPNRLSQAGPGVTWYDFDIDGDDDLVITTGKGGQLAYFRNDGVAGFHRLDVTGIFGKTQHDQTTALGLANEDGSASLLVGKSNLENAKPGNSFVLRYDFQ